MCDRSHDSVHVRVRSPKNVRSLSESASDTWTKSSFLPLERNSTNFQKSKFDLGKISSNHCQWFNDLLNQQAFFGLRKISSGKNCLSKFSLVILYKLMCVIRHTHESSQKILHEHVFKAWVMLRSQNRFPFIY